MKHIKTTILITTLISILTIINPGGLSAQDMDSYKALNHLEQGNKLFKEGKYKKSANEYKIAWEKARLLDALYNLTQLYNFKINNNKLALDYYNEYIAADPYYTDIYKLEQLRDKAKADIENEKNGSLKPKIKMWMPK